MSCCKESLMKLKYGYLFLPKVEKPVRKKETRPAPKDEKDIEKRESKDK